MYMNAMFGAHMLIMVPNDAVTEPTTLTFRHPNLLVNTLTKGPRNALNIPSDYHCYDRYMCS